MRDASPDLQCKHQGVAAVLKRLQRLRSLTEDDVAAFLALPFEIRKVAAGVILVREGDYPDRCMLLLSGYAHRYKLSGDNARQIISINLAGDMLDLENMIMARSDYSIQTLTAAEVAWVDISILESLMHERGLLAEALWRQVLVDASILRERVLSLGRHDARTRVAHLLCEFACRWEAAGLGTTRHFQLPLTQEQIGDATGLTPVHVNRTLQLLEAEGLIKRNRRRIEVENWKQLQKAGDFAPHYLSAESQRNRLMS